MAEIAELLKVNRQTIRNWINDRYLPSIHVGRRVRIAQSDLDAFLRTRQTGNSDIHPPGETEENGARPPAAEWRPTAGRSAAKTDARHRFLEAALKAGLVVSRGSGDLAPALRQLAARAHSWADELDPD